MATLNVTTSNASFGFNNNTLDAINLTNVVPTSVQVTPTLISVSFGGSTPGSLTVSGTNLALAPSGTAFTGDVSGFAAHFGFIDYSISGFTPLSFARFLAVQDDDDAFTLAMTSGNDYATGSIGPDMLSIGLGNDTVFAGGGNDTIEGGAGQDYLRGDDGNDSLIGGDGFDDINGNKGNDIAYGGEGDDWVVGGQDNDLLYGDNGFDIVYGNLGADTIYGGVGNDWVRGGQGDDIVDGGAGNDWLWGDRGNDTVTGGAGADLFHSFSGAGIDRITDFKYSEGDRIVLDDRTAYAITQVGADAVITIGGVDQVILVGVTASSLASDAIYYA